MTDEVRRGPWLSGFLVLAGVMAIATPVLYVFTWKRLSAVMPQWALYTFSACGLLRFLATLAIWNWNKWGVVGYIALSCAVIVIQLAIGQKLGLVALVGVAILIGLVWHKWRYMSWTLVHPN